MLEVASIGSVLRLSAWPSGSCSLGVSGAAAIVQREAGRVVSTAGLRILLGSPWTSVADLWPGMDQQDEVATVVMASQLQATQLQVTKTTEWTPGPLYPTHWPVTRGAFSARETSAVAQPPSLGPNLVLPVCMLEPPVSVP